MAAAKRQLKGGGDTGPAPRSTPAAPLCMAKGLQWGTPKPKEWLARPRLTREDLPAGGEQRGAHREAAVGAIGAVFGLPATAQQELQVLALGLARGGNGVRALPVALHACVRPVPPADAAVKYYFAWKIDRPAPSG